MSTSPTATPFATDEAVQDPMSVWVVIVWDDPVNLMSFVTYVFMKHFGYPRPKAHQLMMQVHTKGKSVVASGSREQMEIHVSAMHSYGLWATLERG